MAEKLNITRNRVSSLVGTRDFRAIKQLETLLADVALTTGTNFTGSVTFNNGVIYHGAIKTADYTITSSDYAIVIDASSNSVTITMPASPTDWQHFNISCADSTNTADIDFNGNNFYTSSSNQVLFSGENLGLMFDGTRWIST